MMGKFRHVRISNTEGLHYLSNYEDVLKRIFELQKEQHKQYLKSGGYIIVFIG